jgi:hypothetical protein
MNRKQMLEKFRRSFQEEPKGLLAERLMGIISSEWDNATLEQEYKDKFGQEKPDA